MENYKDIQKYNEGRILEICPQINHKSGVYIFYRFDKAKIRRAYVGQAVDLLRRCAQHLSEYDHIALSLKKHGLYAEDNPFGWKLWFTFCDKENLDNMEIEQIQHCANAGYQLYNITAGGQGNSKQSSTWQKQPKTYQQGVHSGYLKASKEVAHLFNLHLDYKPKSDTPNKNQEKAMQKFADFLDAYKEIN